MSDLPVLLLLFNRPHHTQRLLENLRSTAPRRLYVHCDGPRAARPDDAEKVAAVRAVVEQTVDWPCELQTLYRDQNAGLRMGVSGAVSWFFEREAYGLILEDDCLPDASAFPFCLELLEKYKDDERIMHISCSNWAAKDTREVENSYLFSRFAYVTGWASWRRAWARMSVDLEGLADFEQSGRLKNMLPNAMARAYLMDKFWVTQRKQNNSWAYAWSYSILRNNGLGIIAKDHLVYNIGFGDADASNTVGRDARGEMKAGSLSFPLKHPLQTAPDPKMEMRFFYASQKTRFRLWVWSALRLLGLR